MCLGKDVCRTYGAPEFILAAHPALTHWANLCRTYGAQLKNDALAALGLGRALQGAGSTKSAPCNGGTLSG